MANVGLGVTIGSHSLRAVKLRRKGEGFIVQRVFADRLDDSTRPVAGRALEARGFKGTPATLGLTGRDVIIRYTQVPPVPDWRLRNLMKFEVEEVSTQSGGDVSADYRKLNLPDPEGERADDTILVALARNRHLELQIKSLGAGGIKLGGGCPNSVALFNAFAINATYTEDETTMLVNIGAQNLDIAIQRDGELLFARNATPGGDAFTEAIQQAFSTSESKAEKMKRAKADVTPKGEARYPDPTSEKVANAIMGVAGQLSSLIQSTLMIAKAQTRVPDLKVDRVLLTGGGASLKGLDKYLKQAMGLPVERFNPFELCDLGQLSGEDRVMVEDAPHEFAVAVGLAQSSLAPAAFDLSVLPAAIKRTRDFVTKGIWSVGAAVVMAGVLFLMYQGRIEAASKSKTDSAKIKKLISQAEAQDDRLRKALRTAQDEEVKYHLMAQRAAPGALLGRVLSVLETVLKDSDIRQVYITDVALDVSEETHTFPYYVPKRRSLASGYIANTRARKSNLYRDASVRVLGRVAGSRNQAADLHGRFYERCRSNDLGLAVVAPRGLEPGTSGRDAAFELLFLPGTVLVTKPDAELPPKITIRSMTLDDFDEPEHFVGQRVDGLPIRVPIADVDHRDVDRRKAKDLVRDLQAARPKEP